MKKSYLFILILILACLLISPVQAKQKDANVQTLEQELNVNSTKESLLKAQEYMKLKEFQKAIGCLTIYINSKPKNYLGYKLRGECYYAIRLYDLAEKDFAKAVQIREKKDKSKTRVKVVSAVILGADKQEQYQNTELGILYAQLMYAQKALHNMDYENSYKSALKYNTHIYLPQPKKSDISRINWPIKYGLKFNAKDADAIINDVVTDISDGNFTESAYNLSDIVNAYPNYYYTYYLTGVVMSGLDNFNEAEKAFKKSIKLNSYDFESYASLGKLYYDKVEKNLSSDDVEKSIKYFNKAIFLDPNNNIYYYYIGLNNLLLRNYNEAVKNYDKAISLKENDYNSLYYKAVALYMLGNYDAAQEICSQLLKKHVSNSNSVLYLRALSYYKQNKNNDSLNDIDMIIQNFEDKYNEDLRVVSDKEKTLIEYVYYLRAYAISPKGKLSKTDIDKAVKNKIINTVVSNKNYDKSNLEISYYDLQNQYDYIITTFEDKNVDIQYISDDVYKLKKTLPIQKLDIKNEKKVNETPIEQKTLDETVSSKTEVASSKEATEVIDKDKTIEVFDEDTILLDYKEEKKEEQVEKPKNDIEYIEITDVKNEDEEKIHQNSKSINIKDEQKKNSLEEKAVNGKGQLTMEKENLMEVEHIAEPMIDENSQQLEKEQKEKAVSNDVTDNNKKGDNTSEIELDNKYDTDVINNIAPISNIEFNLHSEDNTIPEKTKTKKNKKTKNNQELDDINNEVTKKVIKELKTKD